MVDNILIYHFKNSKFSKKFIKFMNINNVSVKSIILILFFFLSVGAQEKNIF